MDDQIKQNTEKQLCERQLVVFKIEKEEFGIEINDVREIIRMEDVTAMPGTEDYIRGIINLRGKIVVVIDLAKKLGIAARETDKNTRVLIVDIENNILGMVVDSCSEVLRITGNKIEPAPEIITQKFKSAYIDGVGIIGERLLILLDISKVLDEKDLGHIKSVEKKSASILCDGDKEAPKIQKNQAPSQKSKIKKKKPAIVEKKEAKKKRKQKSTGKRIIHNK